MYETAFDIVALGMRYFFLAFIVYILFRLVQQSVREFHVVQAAKKRVRRMSPGYLEVLKPENFTEKVFLLSRNNSIGRAKRCDVSADVTGMAQVHAMIYEKKDGLYVADYGSDTGVLLNGERIGKKEELLYTQDILQFGELVCRLHLAGEEAEADE